MKRRQDKKNFKNGCYKWGLGSAHYKKKDCLSLEELLAIPVEPLEVLAPVVSIDPDDLLEMEMNDALCGGGFVNFDV